MLYGEKLMAFFTRYTQNICTLCGQNVEFIFLKVKTSGTYTNR